MKLHTAYFSPTGGTEKIFKAVLDGMGDVFSKGESLDLSKQAQPCAPSFGKDDVLLVAVPSYGGRVPAVALERMEALQGNGARAVLVVSYGNRAYDDTFRELADFLEERGFDCRAAVAGIAEHSIMHQFATGRPDAKDLAELADFGRRIAEKIAEAAPSGKLDVPGNSTYRAYKGVPLKPKAGKGCTGCGACAKLCPVGAIPADNPAKTDKDRCISCMRCVELCPNNARTLNSLMLKVASKKMQAACQDRKDNELFL